MIAVAHTRVLRDSEALERSCGAVTKPDSYNYRTMLPEPRGLYCEDIFGAASLDVNSDETPDGGIVRRAIRLDADERGDRWGHIELVDAVSHPLKRDSLIAHVLVAPPSYRKFIRRTAAESRAAAMKRRGELLAMLADPSLVGDYKAGTDRPDKLLLEEGLDDEDAIQKLGPTWEEPQLNIGYRNVLNETRRLRRLTELAAPEPIVDEQRRAFLAHLAALFEDIAAHPLGDDQATLRALSLVRA